MITKITMISRCGDSEMDRESLSEWKEALESALEAEYPEADISIVISPESGISSVIIDHDGTFYFDEEAEFHFIRYLSNQIWDSIR